MSKPTTNGNGHAKGNDRTQTPATAKADDQGFEVLIEQAEAVKVSLRDSLSKTGELIATLKRHRKQSKAVATTLASLRRLQGVAV
jgi:hypothetical protein